MSDMQSECAASQPFSTIVERSATPLLLFSGSLFSLLLLSWIFLLPKFTSVERPDGTAMTPSAIAAYTRTLAANVSEAEKNRAMFVRAVHDETYRTLVDARAASLTPLDIEQYLRQAAARLGEREAGITFSRIVVDKHIVIVEGDIRNVGTRSLTVLAAFIDSVEQLSIVTDFKRPAFTRETLPDGSMHSPFTFTFTLPSA